MEKEDAGLEARGPPPPLFYFNNTTRLGSDSSTISKPISISSFGARFLIFAWANRLVSFKAIVFLRITFGDLSPKDV